MLRFASNFTNLREMMSAPGVGPFDRISQALDINEMKDRFSSAFKKPTASASASNTVEAPTNLLDMPVSILGLNSSFVEAELKLMESIVKGDGFNDHYEQPYYQALKKAFAQLRAASEGTGGAGAS